MTDPQTTNAGPFPTMGDVDRDRHVSRGGGPRETRFSGAGRKGLSIDPSRRGSGVTAANAVNSCLNRFASTTENSNTNSPYSISLVLKMTVGPKTWTTILAVCMAALIPPTLGEWGSCAAAKKCCDGQDLDCMAEISIAAMSDYGDGDEDFEMTEPCYCVSKVKHKLL